MATYKNPYKGKNQTPAGVMPEDMATKHGLVGSPFCGAGDASYKKTYRHNRKVKALFEQVKRYRQFAHGVHEDRLASTLRNATHYMIEPMSRGNSAGWQGQAAEVSEDGPAPQTILKV